MKGLKINKAALKKAAPEYLGIGIGAVASGYVSAQLPKILPAGLQKPMVLNALPIVLGALLGTQKNAMLSGVGKGMIAVGAQKIAAANGIGAVDYLGEAAPEFIEIEGIDDGANMLGSPGDITNEMTY